MVTKRRKQGGASPVQTYPHQVPVRDSAGQPHTGNSPLVRAGSYAWAFVGLLLAIAAVAIVVNRVNVIAVPLILALFPAALLAPLCERLKRRRVPPALAALIVLIGSAAVLFGVGTVLAPQIAEEIPGLTEQLGEGLDQVQQFLDTGPLGIEPGRAAEFLATAEERALSVVQEQGLGIAIAVAQGVAGLLFLLVTLFFYLKDGTRIAAWVRDLFPERMRSDAEAIGRKTWLTLGAYFQGQLFVAFVDAVFIGLGVWLLRVPLALPIAVLVFMGGLFPIVGAVASGAVAVLVALAATDLVTALAVLGIVLAVQQLESNVLAPVVLGRATRLHPLAVIVVLAIGGIVFGVLGAFLAVPVAASLSQAVGYVRARVPG